MFEWLIYWTAGAVESHTFLDKVHVPAHRLHKVCTTIVHALHNVCAQGPHNVRRRPAQGAGTQVAQGSHNGSARFAQRLHQVRENVWHIGPAPPGGVLQGKPFFGASSRPRQQPNSTAMCLSAIWSRPQLLWPCLNSSSSGQNRNPHIGK